VIPAHNEEELIDRCITALQHAEAHAREEFPQVALRIVVVADSCTDNTVPVLAGWSGIDVLSVRAKKVGVARSAGADYTVALLHHGHATALDNAWLAHTDADSVVPINWFTEQVRLAHAGADVMVGTVRPDFADLTTDQISAWLARHTPGQPNGHVHDANLGIRASAFVTAGGFDPLAEHEDNALVRRLTAAGHQIVASDTCEVLTSGRYTGRTPGGYARYLAHDLIKTQLPPV
jgi:glycosyltransferase involved in cell wall biosynthesis